MLVTVLLVVRHDLSPIFCHSKCRATQQSNGWEAPSDGAKEWVLCGSALSTEERVSSNRIFYLFIA